MALAPVTLDASIDLNNLDFNLVLFLDFDGVLHPDNCGPYEQFSYVGNFVDAMRLADSSHKVPVVISSTWRYLHSLDAPQGKFPDDIASQIVGITPYQTDDDVEAIDDWATFGGFELKAKHRQLEIMQWMSKHAPQGYWIAIDDRPGYFQENEPRLFVVPGGLGGGMTTETAMQFFSKLRETLQKVTT
jgi:hypothetical protein